MMGRCSLYLLVALLGANGMALAAKTPLNASLCAADERVYFSCQAGKGSKRIALCGQVKGAADGVHGFLQYRFGTREHTEMIYPSSRDESLDKFTYGGAYQKLGRMESKEDGKEVATVKCGGEPQESLGDLGWLQ
jgi:hypothetical protein